MNSLCVLTFTGYYNCYYCLQFNIYNWMEISCNVLFLLWEDFKISILSSTKGKTDRSRKEKWLCMCRLCKPGKILFSSKCRIETDILYFPLNYTSSNIHFEQFEILTSSLASHHRKKDKWAKDEDFSPTALIDQRPLSQAEWKNQNGVNRLKCTDIFLYTS